MEHRNIALAPTRTVDRGILTHAFRSDRKQVPRTGVQASEIPGSRNSGEWHSDDKAVRGVRLWCDIERPYRFVVRCACLTEQTERFGEARTWALGEFQAPDLDVP